MNLSGLAPLAIDHWRRLDYYRGLGRHWCRKVEIRNVIGRF